MGIQTYNINYLIFTYKSVNSVLTLVCLPLFKDPPCKRLSLNNIVCLGFVFTNFISNVSGLSRSLGFIIPSL